MEGSELTQLVRRAALDLGFDLVGIAPAGPSPDFERFQRWLEAGYAGEMAYLARRAVERADPRRLLPEARSLIILAASYGRNTLGIAGLPADPSRGLIANYAWGDDYHEVLKPLLFELDGVIRAATGRTSLGRAFVDAGPVLERSWAQAAGLGFIGKNTCLIAPKLGSWFFLAGLLVPEEMQNAEYRMQNSEADVRGREGPVVRRDAAESDSAFLTPAPLPAGASVPRSAFRIPHSALTCGACTRCLDICPTGAFPQPHLLDARRCISYLTIELRGPIPRDLRPLLGNWIFGCDLCQLVCPYNRRFGRPARLAAFQPQVDKITPKLLDLLALDEAAFRQRFRQSPVRRAKRAGLLRNVCVALGNWGDPAALPGLIEALHDDEPLIRGHAAWALGQIGTPQAGKAIDQRLAVEFDPFVRAELSQARTLP